MVEIAVHGQSPSNTSGNGPNGNPQRGTYDAARASNQRFADYDRAMKQVVDREKSKNKAFDALADQELRARTELLKITNAEIKQREKFLKDDARLQNQFRQVQHRANNQVLTPSSYHAVNRAISQFQFQNQMHRQQYGTSAVATQQINSLRQGLGTEGGAFRTAAISRLGSLGQRAGFSGEFTNLVKIQKELERISKTTDRQLKSTTDPVKVASLQRQVQAMNTAKARIGESLEGMSPLRRTVGMGFGNLKYMLNNPVVSAALSAGMTTLAAPYVANKFMSGVLGMAAPFNDFRISTAALGRAGGFDSGDLTNAILPTTRIPRPGMGRDTWMKQLGMGPQDVLKNLQNYGVAERSVPDSLVAAASIRSEYLQPGIGLDENFLGKYLGYGRSSGAVAGGKGFQDSASRYWTQLEKTMATATSLGLDQSRAGNTLMSLQQGAASRGAVSTNASGFADFFSRLAQSGAPGMRSGEGVLSAAANIDSAMSKLGTSEGTSQNRVISSYFARRGGQPTTEEGLRKSLGVDKSKWAEMTKGSAAQGALSGYLDAARRGDPGSLQYLGVLIAGHPEIASGIFEGSQYSNLGPNLTPRLRAGFLGTPLSQSLAIGGATQPGNNVPGGDLQSRGLLEMGRLRRDLNIPAAAAAGVAGSLMGEGLTTGNEAGKPAGQGGYGLAQWSGERRKKFFAWASKQGLDPAAFETQQSYLTTELKNDFPEVYKQLQRPDITAAEAADIWTRGYEKPRDIEGQSALRQGYATGLMGASDANAPTAALNQRADQQAAELNASKYVSDSVTVMVTAFDSATAAIGRFVSGLNAARPGPTAGGQQSLRDWLAAPLEAPVAHDGAAYGVPAK